MLAHRPMGAAIAVQLDDTAASFQTLNHKRIERGGKERHTRERRGNPVGSDSGRARHGSRAGEQGRREGQERRAGEQGRRAGQERRAGE